MENEKVQEKKRRLDHPLFVGVLVGSLLGVIGTFGIQNKIKKDYEIEIGEKGTVVENVSKFNRNMTPTLNFQALTKEEALKWQEQGRVKLKEILFLSKTIKDIEKTNPEIVLNPNTLTERTMYEGSENEYLLQTLSLNNHTLAKLATPKNANSKAVLALHGHGVRLEDIFNSESLLIKTGDVGYEDWFAKKGYTVISPWISSHRNDTTWNLNGRRVYQARTALEYLVQSKKFDEVIGIGHSMGGEIIGYTAAIDPRIDTTIISGWFTSSEYLEGKKAALIDEEDNDKPKLSYEDIMLGHVNCPCWRMKGLLENFYISEIPGLITPRKIIIQSGEQDEIFPAYISKSEIGKLQRIYDLIGGEVIFQVHDDGHRPRVDLLNY